MATFPNLDKEYNENKNVSNRIFGNRFHIDQSLYEYLIEFLLIFSSAKDIEKYNDRGLLRFHKKGENFKYYAESMMGLRRFIFFDSSKKDKSIPFDEQAYQYLCDELNKSMDLSDNTNDKVISAVQDLLRGYAVVLKNRTWCAQQILPICPELIFCEAMPNQKERKKVISYDNYEIDTKFDFKQRNFLARGGELYYLHLLHALFNDLDSKRMELLNKLLTNLLTEQSANISKIVRFIQNVWYESLNGESNEKDKLFQQYNLSYIPENAYIKCESKAVDELISYLSSDFQQIKKIEILAKGVVFQIMRMMYCAICNKLNINQKPWILDMTNNTSKTIKQIASNSYRSIEEDFKLAINITAEEMGYHDKELINRIKDAQKDSLDIFRSKGKEMRCIIPISGPFERLTLSEDILRFLVCALVKPNEKITFEMFLDRLYENYGIVIGSKQFEATMDENNHDQLAIKNCLYVNEICFQNFLKSTGFLKELSDSTSLVYNPYDSIN